MLKDQTAIVGIGQTPFGRSLPDTELQLACEAVVAALDDAGMHPQEVDGLFSYTFEPDREFELARNVGLGEIRAFNQVGYGGGGGCGVVGSAALAVASGQANVAVAWRARKRGARKSRPWAQVHERVAGSLQWSRPFGLLRPVDEVGMLTRRYMHEYGATREHLANVALAARKHANTNPAAQMRSRELTHRDYMDARWISEPLCLYDCCLETDGALAVVIVSEARAADHPHRPVYIHGFAQGIAPQHQPMTDFFREDPLRGPGWTCARALWQSADFTPDDVDTVQLYDAFTPLILLTLEAYGFCERGEAGSFTEDGNLEVGSGNLPFNTSGGSLSEAYVHGFNLIVEGVRQMRGQSVNQVDNAGTCLVTSGEAVPTSALLLRN